MNILVLVASCNLAGVSGGKQNIVEYVNPNSVIPEKKLYNLPPRLSKKRGLGSSLPERLNRPAWYLDFPKWQEIKSAWNGAGGGERPAAVDRKASKLSFDALLEVAIA